MFTSAVILRTDYNGAVLEITQQDKTYFAALGSEDIKNMVTDHNKSRQDGYCYILLFDLSNRLRFIYSYELQDGYIVDDLTPKYLFH